MVHSVLPDENNTNKQLRHYDESGKYVRLSVDETIANNLNAWEGWTCSAGTKGLYIDFDGNIWICNTASAAINRYNYKLRDKRREEYFERGEHENKPDEIIRNDVKTLIQKFGKLDEAYKNIYNTEDKLPGLLGNIYNGFTLPKSKSICKWKSCGCGADVFLAKAKDDKSFGNLAVYNNGFYGQRSTKIDLVETIKDSEIVGVEPNFPIPYQILWDLGRTCNYDCSYCWPSVHNRDGEHKSLEIMMNTANKIITEWSNNESIRWNFGGGEPTLNPYFLDFIKYLKSHNQWILITTNGSRPRKYWKEAVNYINSVNLSVHFEFVNETKLLGNIEEICNHFNEHDDDHWLEIKLMATPESLIRAVALKETIRNNTSIHELGANNRIKGAVSLVPIRSLGNSGTLVEYTEEQLKLLQQQ